MFYLTCTYLGAVLLGWGPRSFDYLVEVFKNVSLPELDSTEAWALAWLLHVPVVLFGAGYLGTVRLAGIGPGRRANEDVEIDILGRVIWVAWAASLIVCWLSLYRGGALADLSGSWELKSWLDARWQLFAELSYAEFVNLYVLLPLSTGLVLNRCIRNRWYTIAVCIWFVGLATTLLLFQKKQPVIYILFTLCTIALYTTDHRALTKKLMTTAVAASVVFVAIFFAVEFYGSSSSDSAREPPRGDESEPRAGMDKGGSGNGDRALDVPLLEILRADRYETVERKYYELTNRDKSILKLVNNVIFRTGYVAFVYPAIFPNRHSYLGIDWPFDGFVPNDNRIIWEEMNPNHPGGTSMSSFQFNFYAQDGFWVVVLKSLLLGAALGLMWSFARWLGVSTILGSTQAALVLTGLVLLSIDSARNALTASYGVGWGMLVIAALALGEECVRRQRLRRRGA